MERELGTAAVLGWHRAELLESRRSSGAVGWSEADRSAMEGVCCGLLTAEMKTGVARGELCTNALNRLLAS